MTTRPRKRTGDRPDAGLSIITLAMLGVVATALALGVLREPLTGAARAAELPTDATLTAEAPAAPRVHAGATLQVDDFYIHIPPGAVEPLTPVLVLHGMGDGGRDFSELVRARCDAEHWVIVAPTFPYGDWKDPAVLTRESTAHFPRINTVLDQLPALAGMRVREQIFVYGFSRGAQAAHRYAMAYPERVAAVAMMSAGTYTLPAVTYAGADGPRVLLFPYGVANLQELFGQPFDAAAFQRIPFWVAVGGRDNDPTEVPRQWDTYEGANRVERAQRFTQFLRDANMSAELHIFPTTGHAVPPEASNGAMDFLAAHL